MDLKGKEFEEFVKKNKVCAVDFWAPWCGPCRMLAPVLESVCKDKGVALGKVNIDENREIATAFGVMSIPCVVKFEGGKEKDRFVGCVPRGRVESFIG